MEIGERETIVRYDYVDGTVTIWTTQLAIMKKCRKAGWFLVSESRNKRKTIIGQEWRATAKDISISIKKPGREKIRTGFALRPKDVKAE